MAKAVSTSSNRVLALDIIRGMFLVVILIDHIELYPNLFSLFTGEGRLYASAAEGFFFLSGMVVGLVYRRRIERGFKFIFKRLWRRAAELYILSVILTLLFAYAAVKSNHADIKYGLPAVINWPHIIYQSFVLHFSFGWADFLSRFAILTFLSPFAIWLLSRGQLRLLAAASIITWGFRGTNFIAAWQILFGAALVVGFYWNEILGKIERIPTAKKRLGRRALMWTAGITFAFSWLNLFVLTFLQNSAWHLPAWVNHFSWSWNNFDQAIWKYCDKFTLGPGRMAFFIVWFSALYLVVVKYEAFIRKYSRDWLLLLGQNSLFVYIAHAFIVFLFKIFIPNQTTKLQNTLITTLALLVMAAVMTARALVNNQLNIRPFSDFRFLPGLRRSLVAHGDGD